ncbi:2-keto-4-pentenoate hydratase [Clostridium autoethanogenum]|uniref:Fumarylacetoacetate hydrolase family protein n=1 Tax=Clostridium autoethanogenum DSM 10061 TaxID=1341692 RepID=A0ABM5NW06_9CLOT|nr:fumarylacetoacetate hydrolase family protein [Clostridium autoethanogenum]AGY76602.1 fumarylacetoacetate hydrolase family protein [Clostridium autoethanogenum DSM 10061]ALU36759.1 'putative molybdopterin binding domain [Clostridium autoethanogenum DSM 10061]OVY50551.1 2-hydroxyhexa-2,4-dienoate hydratase [Clostridium autoethanogenum]
MDYEEVAKKLLKSEANKVPIGQLTEEYSDMTIEDAYHIQLAGINIKLSQGHKIIGKKIGLTSRGMQKLLGVNEPDYGHLLDNMLVLEGDTLDRRELIAPKVEGELAFILNETLKGPGVTIADVYRATEGIVPAFEIVDSRIKDWKIKLADTIADNGSSARLVLGSKMIPIKNLDLKLIGMMFEKNGQMVSSGVGAEVLGNPAAAVAWLANKLGTFDIALEKGEIVLAGAFTAAEKAEEGDIFTVSFNGLGSVSVKFV